MDENEFESEESENEEIKNMYFRDTPHQHVLRCLNTVLIIDLRSPSNQFFVSGNYIIYLLPNAAIEYKYLLDNPD
jgi:hypothetical protein